MNCLNTPHVYRVLSLYNIYYKEGSSEFCMKIRIHDHEIGDLCSLGELYVGKRPHPRFSHFWAVLEAYENPRNVPKYSELIRKSVMHRAYDVLVCKP